MRIIHVTDTFAPIMGGIETQVARLASQQAAAGHEVIVLTTAMREPRRGRPRTKSQGLSEDTDTGLPYRVIRSQWQNPFGAPVDPHAPGAFLDVIDELQPDAVHAHVGEVTPVAMSVLARLADEDVPTVASVHSIWSRFPTVPLYRFGAQISPLLQAPFVWIPNSELTAKAVRKTLPGARVEVLNNSVDPSDWQVTPVEHEGLVAVSAARFAPRKRVGALLGILRDTGERLGINTSVPAGPTRKLGPLAFRGSGGTSSSNAQRRAPLPLRAVIAGEGPGLEAARRYVERHGMADWVDLPGRLDQRELLDLYARSDVYISPSVKDAFSISGLEARAAGLAILARSQSGFGAAVLDGKEGRAVPTDKAMVETLVKWARDPDLVSEYVAHNRATPISYTWEESLPQLDALYKEAARLRDE